MVPCPPRPPPPCYPPYILIELLCQFLDMTQDTLRVVLICTHPCHLMGHQLEGGEKGGGVRGMVREGGVGVQVRAEGAPHRTGLWGDKGPHVLTRSLQRPCPPAPSSGNHPPPVHAGPKRLPGGTPGSQALRDTPSIYLLPATQPPGSPPYGSG